MLFTRLTVVLVAGAVLLGVALSPAWIASADFQEAPASHSGFQLENAIRVSAAITFTPVATVYVPSIMRGLETTEPPPGAGNVVITRIEYDPAVGTDAEGEYVELKNTGAGAADLTDWTLRDEADTVYTFPAFTLNAQATVRVWVKSGTNDATNLYWGRSSAVWNNGGDTATLRNAEGIDVDSCTYPGGDPGFVDCSQ